MAFAGGVLALLPIAWLPPVTGSRMSISNSLASTGREPCVLITHDSGDIAMIVDWNDVALAKDVASYERILRSKLLMY